MAHKYLNQDLWQGRWTPRVRPSSPKFLLLWAGSQSTVVRFYWNCSKAGMMVNWRWESGWSRIHCARGEGRLVMVVWSNQPAAVAWTAKNYLKASAEKKSSLLLTFLMIVGHVLYCLRENRGLLYSRKVQYLLVLGDMVSSYGLCTLGSRWTSGGSRMLRERSCWRTWVLLKDLGLAGEPGSCYPDEHLWEAMDKPDPAGPSWFGSRSGTDTLLDWWSCCCACWTIKPTK